MNATKQVPQAIPEVPINRLTEGAKDFLIAHGASGKPLPQIICEQMNKLAAAAGFSSPPPQKGDAK